MARLGTVLAGVFLAASLMAPVALGAATVTVDKLEDSFDGTCADDCSLRDAIASVDAGGTIRVPPGFYELSLAGDGGIETGDLDVDRPMTLVGTGSLGAFVDASALEDRAFDLRTEASLQGLTLIGGSQVSSGGLVRVVSGTARLTDSTLIGGTAREGGAVAVGEGAAIRLVRSWVSGSLATERGGAISVRGHATLVRSTLSESQAGAGAGIWVADSGSLEVSNSTISGNEGARGGGGLHVRGVAELRSATVARNRASVAGGVLATATADVTLGSSVFEGNQATDRAPTCSRALTSNGHNVADGFGCDLDSVGDLAGVDPMLGPLRQNGGPTPTHALRTDSRAIGNGGSACSPLDQRGAPRRDCDSGAYELVFCLDRPVTMVGTARADDLSGGLDRDVFLGRGGDDVFQGSLANDRACGGPGDDHLIAGPGDDRLAGESGADRLEGEDGDDRLLGGPGRDACLGGDGLDLARGCERVTSAA
jgi:Ca2+-binding RTX toxin-like protein